MPPEGVSGRFAVLLAKPGLLRDPRVPQVLTTALKIPFADAARRATTAWGIVGERLEEAKARELAGALGAAGLETLVLPEDRLPVLPAAKPVTSAAFGLQSVKLFLRDNGMAAEPAFAEIAVLAAAAFHIESSKTVTVKEGPTQGQKMASLGLKLATGLPINIGGKERVVKKEVKSTELVFRLELVTRGGECRYGIEAENFNYSCLGPKMEYGTPLNFRALLELLRERLPHAAPTRGTSVFLARQPVGTMGYDVLKDLERELRWLLALAP